MPWVVAVVTRAEPVHLEGMGSLDRIREEKSSLLDFLAPGGTAWVNGDDAPLVAAARARAPRLVEAGQLKIYGWETEGPCDLQGRSVRATDGGIVLEWDGNPVSVPLLGLFSAGNVLAAVAVARTLGLLPGMIAERLATFVPPAGRMNLQEIRGCWILDDTYNSNPLAMREAVKQLLALPHGRRRVVVMADMLELGEEGPALHRELGAGLGRQGLSGLWTVGPLARQAAEAALASGMAVATVASFFDKVALGDHLAGAMQEGDAVLFKGSRGWALDEEVVKCCTICCTR